MEWKPLEYSALEREWMEAREQAAREILNAFKITAPLVGIIEDLKANYNGSESWLIAPATYDKLLYLDRLSRLRPLPRRKLRKCQLRKYYQTRKKSMKRQRVNPLPFR